MEVKVVPLLVLSHNPPEAAPATISPVLSAATAVMRPVIITLLPTVTPVKLAASDIGTGPIEDQVPDKAAAGALNSPSPPAMAAAEAPRWRAIIARIFAAACTIACFGIPN